MKRIGAAMACALGVWGCGSSGTHTVTVTSTSTASTSTPASASTSSATTSPTTTSPASSDAIATVHLATFKSPSGNIGCTIIAGTARCDIVHRRWSPPPRPKSCPQIVDFGQGLIVGNTGAGRLVCAGDTARDPRAPALAYNTDTVVGSLRCASRSDGMTCTNTGSGHGFFIAIQSYRAF
jgi:hypothetical protein